MRTLVFGRTGQVAIEIMRAADVISLGREEVDLSNPESCAAAIRTYNPKAVINAAAYTAVDLSEDEEALATRINGDAPAAMARACAALDIPLVHISTDYVFDGAGQEPHRPDHPVRPLGAYGRSKLAGEQGVRAAGGPHVILRTSWIVSAHGSNFVKTMLRVGPRQGTVRVVDDQVGGPTPASDLAGACLKIIRHLVEDPSKSGTYHFSGAPDTSWAEFAKAIFNLASLDVTVNEIMSSDYPTPAQRPLNSRLDCSATKETFDIAQPDWLKALADILSDLKKQDY